MSKSGLGKFLAGLAVGVGLGVLFAPQKGSETQKELKAKIDELLAKARETDVDDVREAVEAKAFEIKLLISELDKEKTLKMAKQKAKKARDLAEELVDYSVEKGTPVVQKMADNVRAKAIEATEEVLQKLEEKDQQAKNKKK